MAILDRFRGGDGEEEGRGRPPVDEVRRLTDDGYSESEITETLRDRGYSYGEINEAINQAVQEQTVDRGPSGGQAARGEQPPSDPGGTPEPPQSPPPQQGQQAPPAPAPEPEPVEGGEDADGFGQPSDVTVEEEELIETIIAEHFTEVEDEFNQLYSELDRLEERLEGVEDRVEELEIREDEDQQEFMQRVEEMEEYLAESQSRIGGMEKAFQQVLPSLVENTRELSSLVKEMKEEE